MSRFVVAGFLAIFASDSEAGHADMSGRAMLESCREAARQEETRTDRFHQGFCSGVVLSTVIYNPGGLICEPKSADVEQAINLVVRYMERTPDELDEDLSALH